MEVTLDPKPDADWIVEVYGYMPERFRALTSRKAMYKAFLQFRDGVTRLSFRDFLARGVTVRRATPHDLEGRQ